MRNTRAAIFTACLALAACAAAPSDSATSCPVREHVKPYPDWLASISSQTVIENTENKTYRIRWPLKGEEEPGTRNRIEEGHPPMLLATFEFSGPPNQKRKPKGKRVLGLSPDAHLYEKVEAITFYFVAEKHGEDCQLSVPLERFPFLRNIDPTGLDIHVYEDPSKYGKIGNTHLDWDDPKNLLNDRIYEISFPFETKSELELRLERPRYYDQCANFFPVSGKSTYPLWGRLVINFEGEKPSYRVSPDCQKWRKDRFGTE